MKYIPHAYQSPATDFILSHPVCAILLQMGLGKSVITLTALEKLLSRGEVRHVLVIAPLRVARDTWPEEIRKWDHVKKLTFAVAVGSAAERREALNQDVQIHILNRENVPWLVGASGIPFRWDMIVIDELSSFKNPQAKRFRALLKVRPKVRRIVGLTGTPAPGGYMDLFAEYRLLDLGERLGRFVTGYRSRYFDPDRWGNGQVYSWKLKPGAREQIDEKIRDITVSMKSVDYLRMPEYLSNRVEVHMDPAERRMYEQLKEQLFLQVLGSNGEGTQVIDAKNAAVLCGKLSQLASGAVYTEEGNIARIHDRKLDALEDLIEAAGGNPMLVAYWYRHDLERIRERFPFVRPLQTARDMAEWNAGNIPVAALHPAAAGHGLNLQAGGNTLVWFSLTWSLEMYQQTNARLWRQGQRADTVVIQHLVTKDTIDEEILTALERKDMMQDALMDAVRMQYGEEKRA